MLETTSLIDLLPVEAADRLRAIHRSRDDASAVMRGIVERTLESRATRQDAEVRLRQLTRTTRPLPPDHPSVQQAQRAFDAANAELARLANREATAAAAFNHASHLATAIERWALSHTSQGRMFAPAPTIEPRLLPREDVISAISRNRTEVRRLEADLHACRSAPIPAAEAKAIMREQVAALVARGRPYVEGALEHGEEVTFAAQDMRTLARSEPPSFVGWSQFDALATFAWLHQKALTDKLAAEIDAAAVDDAALSKADRRKKEAELLSDISGTQKQIAALIRAAEAENIEVTFEADADPAIVLGVVVVDAPRSVGVDLTAEVLRQHRAVADAEAITATIEP